MSPNKLKKSAFASACYRASDMGLINKSKYWACYGNANAERHLPTDKNMRTMHVVRNIDTENGGSL
jgi:hypothetical protein